MTIDSHALRGPMTAPRFILGLVLGFGALCAFGGGIYGMSGADGTPADWLAGSPFATYFVPSAILFFVVGGSWLGASLAVFANAMRSRRLAITAGAIMIGWIAAQVAIIGFRSWLQPASAGLGALVVLLAAVRRDGE
jgi:hypothetical protein